MKAPYYVVLYSEICEDYRCFDTDISLYPARDLLFYTSDIHGNLLTKQRIQVMRRVLESSGGVVVTTISASAWRSRLP